MSNRWHSGLFDPDKLKKVFVDMPMTILKGGTPLQPRSLNMPAKQNLKVNRMQNEDLRRVQGNPVQRFRRNYRRGD